MIGFSKCKKEGFTLTEVVIALGIFSTGLLIIVGIIPQTLGDLREASSKSIQRRIAQNLINEMMLTSWGQIHDFDGGDKSNLRYFDAQAIPTRGFTDDTIFTARILVLPRDVNIDQDRSLEGLGSSTAVGNSLPDDESLTNSTNLHARRLIVEVVDVPIADFDFDSEENSQRILRVGTVVSNLNEISP